MDPAAAPSKASPREWMGLAVIALPCLLYSMDLTVLNLALPSLSAELAPSSAQLLWIVDIYGFMVAGMLITMGTLGDRIGRRRLLLIGAAAFGVASVLAAFSTSAAMLIATRAVLGIAGATIAPSTLSLIRNMFHDARERTFAIGVWITSYSVGAAIGPVLGGVLLEYFRWGSVFLIGVPVMLLLLVLGPVLLPEYRNPAAGRLDLRSAALSLSAVLATIYGLKQMAEHGPSWGPALSIAAGIAVGIVFVRRQARLADPLIDLQLFRVRAFSASLAAYTLGCFVLFGVSLFVAQYLQLVLGLSPLHAGLWTAPWALAFVVGSMATPAIARRFRPAMVMAAGLALSAVGFAVLTQASGTAALAIIVAGTIILSLGLAPVFTLANDVVVGTAPPERAGAASAISETSSELGGALGIAILGSIGAAVYRAWVADGVPRDLSQGAMQDAINTLAGAVEVAGALPRQQSLELLVVARDAFARSMDVIAVISAGVVIAAAVFATLLLRRSGTAASRRPGTARECTSTCTDPSRQSTPPC